MNIAAIKKDVINWPNPRILFPSGKFGTVVADPPWRFGNTVTRASAEKHYGTMPTGQIMCMPIDQMTLPNSHLYLWTTASHLSDALQVMQSWGFTYKLNIIWVKTKAAPKLQIGLGNYFRHAHEMCLFGVKGSTPAKVHNLPTVLFAPRTKHSRKPELLQDWAEQLSPGPYLELFARRDCPGWTTWGNELRQAA